jgi:hypothetical protein
MLASDKNICKGVKDNACGKKTKNDSWGVGETCACLGFGKKNMVQLRGAIQA